MVAGCVVVAASCGADDDEAVRPVVDQIVPAIAAVEDELGGPQQFFEINATPQVVNLFVATDGGTMVTPYVYVGGEVASPAEPTTAEGATFVADAVTFDAATILDGVTDELPDSDVARLSIVGGPGGAVRYGATVRVRRRRHAGDRARTRRHRPIRRPRRLTRWRLTIRAGSVSVSGTDPALIRIPPRWGAMAEVSNTPLVPWTSL